MEDLKPSIRLQGAIDPQGNGGGWKDFKRLVTCVVLVVSTLSQISPKNKKQPLPGGTSHGKGGPICIMNKGNGKIEGFMQFDTGCTIPYIQATTFKRKANISFEKDRLHLT